MHGKRVVMDKQRLREIDKALKGLDKESKTRYCDPFSRMDACACMGCVDSTLSRNGITKAEWTTWVESRFPMVNKRIDAMFKTDWRHNVQ